MKRTARLTLKRETLAELSGADLSGVAGAAAPSSPTCVDCPTDRSCLECLIGATLPDTACVPEITFRTICRK